MEAATTPSRQPLPRGVGVYLHCSAMQVLRRVRLGPHKWLILLPSLLPIQVYIADGRTPAHIHRCKVGGKKSVLLKPQELLLVQTQAYPRHRDDSCKSRWVCFKHLLLREGAPRVPSRKGLKLTSSQLALSYTGAGARGVVQAENSQRQRESSPRRSAEGIALHSRLGLQDEAKTSSPSARVEGPRWASAVFR